MESEREKQREREGEGEHDGGRLKEVQSQTHGRHTIVNSLVFSKARELFFWSKLSTY